MYHTFNAGESRAVWFAAQESGGPPSGQQVSAWLPAGTYKLCGREVVQVSNRGNLREFSAIRCERKNAVYYVSPNFLPSEVVAGFDEHTIPGG